MAEMNIEQTISNFNQGKLDMKLCWQSWFCRDRFLTTKGKKLLRKLIEISKSRKFSIKKTYVYFNNNWASEYPFFDEFVIFSSDSREVLYKVIPSVCGKSEVWGAENHFSEPLVNSNWDDVKKFFLG